ncbi:MAG: hypothetical protein DI543_15245 [Bradyrhizobium icense]|jgi:hypothetical protein|nr:MAG: hypothetical protein DI543_15245 [Bradyrhizobium icense]
MIVHQKSFRGLSAVMELPFAETLAAPMHGAIHHNVHAQSGVVARWWVGYLVEKPVKRLKTRHFR